MVCAMRRPRWAATCTAMPWQPTGPCPVRNRSMTSRIAYITKRRTLITRYPSVHRRTEIISSMAAPGLRFTPLRISSRPPPMAVQRGRVSSSRSAATATGCNPLSLCSQSCAPGAMRSRWTQCGGVASSGPACQPRRVDQPAGTAPPRPSRARAKTKPLSWPALLQPGSSDGWSGVGPDTGSVGGSGGSSGGISPAP